MEERQLSSRIMFVGGNQSREGNKSSSSAFSECRSSKRQSSRSSTSELSLSRAINSFDREFQGQGLVTPRKRRLLENRQVRDKSYYMGLLYRKGYEIRSEMQKLLKSIALIKADQSTYISYRQKAQKQAHQLKDLQNTLAYYNLADDMYNKGMELSEIEQEYKELAVRNKKESSLVDNLFESVRDKESVVKELETEIDQEKYVSDILTTTASPVFYERYKNMNALDKELKSSQIELEKELNNLKIEKKCLEDRCVQLKRSDTYDLFCKLQEEEHKRDNLLKEQNLLGATGEIQQRKADHLDLIRCMSKRTRGIKLQISEAEKEIESLTKGEIDVRAERVQKLAKLQNREKMLDTFLASYQENQINLSEKQSELQHCVAELLEKMSRQLHFDTRGFYSEVKNEKSSLTIRKHNTRELLKQELIDLLAKESLEDKLLEEINTLKENIAAKKKEMIMFSDIESLKAGVAIKKTQLLDERKYLIKQRDTHRMLLKDLQDYYDSLEEKLEINKVYIEISLLEKQWRDLEEENFSIQEYLAEARIKGNYIPIKRRVMEIIKDLNEGICK